MKKPYSTWLIAKAELVEPNTDKFKAVASNIKAKYGFDLKPQIDLMYVRSCLVTAGINSNDDGFTNEELWNARHTPVMKPTNWQHKDKDIIGVVYSVEARDLDGNILDFNQDNPPKVPYELWTEAAIFKLIHEGKAKEIQDRYAKDSLFVSMEVWFDDYNYAFMNENNITKVIARNENTSFLDTHLRANGGSGKYKDQRIARVLIGCTFGGYGFVDVPANKRSIIDSVSIIPDASLDSTSSDDKDFNDILKSLFSEQVEENEMIKATAGDNETQTKLEDVADVIVTKLEEKETAKARAAAEAAEKERIAKVEASLSDANKKVTNLETSLKEKAEAAVTTANLVEKMNASVANLVKDVAGATNDTPPEIAAIDAAKGGEEAFNAKIAWISKSMAALAEKAKKDAAELNDLRKGLAEAALALREQEIRGLFDNVMTKEEVEVLVKAGLTKADADYKEWLAEKELFVARIKSQGNAEDKNGDEDNKNDESDDNKPSMAAVMAELAKRRNITAREVNSGVSPESLRKPRHKIAGSTKEETSEEEILDGVEPENEPNLSDAKGAEDDGKNPFKTLAHELCGLDKERPERAKAAFDPVQ